MTLSGAIEAVPGVTLGEEPLAAVAEVTLEKPESALVRIEVTAPTKVDCEQGEDLDLAGMKVEAVYSDGADESRVDVTDKVTVEGFDSEATGTQTITVTYEGMADTFQVTVAKAETPDPGPDAGTDSDPGTDPDHGVDPEPGTDLDPDAKPGIDDGQQTPDADGPAEIPATGDAPTLWRRLPASALPPSPLPRHGQGASSPGLTRF